METQYFARLVLRVTAPAGDAEISRVRAEQGGPHPLFVIATRSAPGKWLAARLCEDSQLPLDPTETGSVLVMILRWQHVSLRNTDLMAASAAPVDTCVGCLNTGIEQNVICCKIFLLKELIVFVLSHFRTFFSLEKQQSLERGPSQGNVLAEESQQMKLQLRK
ncbi:hypothetical protein PTKU15_85400 [Paraburkholderia terrae]|nr:hypothetical protein PTKU15_85400 [Paraburkholderia terrae]